MFQQREVTTPYPGLRPFEPYEAEIFFGRDSQTDRLLEVLQREHFLAVVGPSGCGKSSLVRAGMLPALAAGWLGTGSSWRIALFRPGDRPLRGLARSLLDSAALGAELCPPHEGEGDDKQVDVALVEAELRRGPHGLIDEPIITHRPPAPRASRHPYLLPPWARHLRRRTRASPFR